MKIHRSRAALASLAVFGILGAMVFASPAYAAAQSAPDLVDQATHARGLPGSDSSSGPVIVAAGQPTAVSDTNDSLTVVGTAATSRSRASGVVYTADRLDANSVRFTAVLDSSQRTTGSWDFGAGNQLLVLPDGRVSVTDSRGTFIAGIDVPWALDANGRDLETYYTADGTTLTQHVVVTTQTAFPVVADPTVHTYFGYYTVALNHSESVIAVSTTGACAALFSKSPVPAMKALMIGCAVFAAYGTPQVAGGHCLTIHVAGFPPILGTWWPTFPKC